MIVESAIRCTCHLHTNSEPGYVRCRVDHDEIAEQIARLRTALLWCADLRRDAMANESNDEIAAAKTGDDAMRAINRATRAHLNSEIKRLVNGTAQHDSDDVLQLRQIIALCEHYDCFPASPGLRRALPTPPPGEAGTFFNPLPATDADSTGASVAGSHMETAA